MVHTSGLSEGILVAGSTYFEDELAEEATWACHSHPHHVHFAADPQRGFTPQKFP